MQARSRRRLARSIFLLNWCHFCTNGIAASTAPQNKAQCQQRRQENKRWSQEASMHACNAPEITTRACCREVALVSFYFQQRPNVQDLEHIESMPRPGAAPTPTTLTGRLIGSWRLRSLSVVVLRCGLHTHQGKIASGTVNPTVYVHVETCTYACIFLHIRLHHK